MYDFSLIPLEQRHQDLPTTEYFGSPPAYSEKTSQVIKTFNEKKSEDSEQDAIRKTGIEMALPIETVKECITYSEFFENSTLRLLANAKLIKRQYQDILKIVQRAALKFCQDDLTDKEIHPWVTKLVKGMLSELKKHSSLNRKSWILEWESRIGYKKTEGKTPENILSAPRKKIFSYHPGVTRALYGPKTAEDIHGKLYYIIENLSNLPQVDTTSVVSLKKSITKILHDLGSIGIALKDIEKEDFQEVDPCII
ncbi:MAG: hypothetical protein FP812_05345 [Desulfobacula sp.]|nr:hypothetical protein [Desulfobacula sp.]MBU3914108.1 hypothetical protein [bacterium]